MKSIYYRFFILGLFFTASAWSWGQNGSPIKLQGSVVDIESGESLPGVTVQVKGTASGTTTDRNGKFLIELKELPVTLSFSSTGFRTQEVEVQDASEELTVQLAAGSLLGEVVVTSRRREENAQDVPIPISIVSGPQIEQAGAFNVNRVKELVPSVQLYTSNPRNTGLSIRGLGSSFGLTNDGLDPGVGFYVDGVYYARPAAATLDFIDIDQIEILRGPQGTLFGKNTTAGAFNITTRKASFTPGGSFELSYGNFGYIQAKASITGPLSKKLAGRISFSGTQRDGVIYNQRTLKYINDINNLGFRGQLLYKPSANTSITLAADNSSQRPDGYAQVVAGVVQTKRAAYRQFNAIIADLNYVLPSQSAFDRVVDQDTPWNSGNDLGGVSLNIDTKLGPGTLTSTSAWRYWKWTPSNDRDFTGLQALSKSANFAYHDNWSQEIRYAGELSSRLTGVIGLFALGQEVKSDPEQIEESGKDQWRFVQSTTSTLWKTPGLFDGFGIKTRNSIKSLSAAVFANFDWEIVDGLHVMPGIRYNYDKKDVFYDRVTYGGLQTTDPALLALKATVYTDQNYSAKAEENNFTYQFTLAYKANKRINAFATYSTSFKPVGVNVAGLPTINNLPATDLAVIKPEYVTHYEVGIKTSPTSNITLNLVAHNTDIKDYQTQVQSPELNVNRGYLANAEKVNVNGVEVDASIIANNHFTFYASGAYTEGKYVTFTNAPLPLEETGKTDNGVQIAFQDISGGRLPGISTWATSVGGEFTTPSNFLRQPGKFFTAVDTYYRSEFSSSASPSAYLNIPGYSIVNARTGFRVATGTSLSIWVRNLFDINYFEQLLPAGGNAGQYAGVLGDQRTYGVTLKHTF